MVCRMSLSLIVLASFVVLASCNVDIRVIFSDALERIASEHETSLDRTKLAGGFCFTTEDGGAGGECQHLPEGNFINLERTIEHARSFVVAETP